MLQHTGLQQLVLEGGRTGRLAIRTPQVRAGTWAASCCIHLCWLHVHLRQVPDARSRL